MDFNKNEYEVLTHYTYQFFDKGLIVKTIDNSIILNETATFIFKCVIEGMAKSNIINEIFTNNLQISKREIEFDVSNCLSEFETLNLIKLKGGKT